MKISICHSSLGFTRGGLETIATRLAKGLAERGHEVTCITGTWPTRSMPADLVNLPVRWLCVPCLPADLTLRPGSCRQYRARLLKLQSLSFAAACRWHPTARSAVASADVTVSLLEFESANLSRWREKNGDAHLSYCPGAIDGRWLQRDRSTVRLAISNTLLQVYREKSDVRMDGVVTPGIDAIWLAMPREVRPRVVRLLFTGRLEGNKGVLQLLQLFQALALRWPNLQLRMVGDGPLRHEVSERARAAGLATRVSLLGAVPASQVWRELREADLFLFPSRYESFGLSVLEALATGVPVVCSDLPVMHETTGGAARLLPAEDVAGWEEEVSRLITDVAERRRLSEHGRRHAQAFTWEKIVERFDTYLRLARKRTERSKSPLVQRAEDW